MRTFTAIVLIMLAGCTGGGESASGEAAAAIPFALVIHGGAGTIARKSMSAEREAEYRKVLGQALDTGYDLLDRGKSSTEAVVAVIRILEDSPLFNAGKGAVFTADGTNELDASIMEGATLRAGAVTGVTTVRNPIEAALAVMEKSEHVILSGKGADTFAREQGLEIVEPAYFVDSARFEQWRRRHGKEGAGDDGTNARKFGTVGCVALDRKGNITAGTSTGGMSNKRFGRIGDSPIIGAGTYANNATCGVSCTGWGEYYIRLSIAHDISAMMEYADLSLDSAMRKAIHGKLPALGGDGGAIALDRQGNISMEFNTEGMYRGYRRAGEAGKIAIYSDEK